MSPRPCAPVSGAARRVILSLEPLEPRVLLSEGVVPSVVASGSLDLSASVFVENLGQWDKEVRYGLEASGASVFVTDSGLVFALADPEPPDGGGAVGDRHVRSAVRGGERRGPDRC